ncbi:MAG TPA: hypothetical protein VKW09_08165 [bacterium]|nr:hypothetical protein [bacterium]
MRAAVLTGAAILTLIAGCLPGLASAQDEADALDFIRMTGPLAGWAATAIREPGPNMLLRTTDGGVHWDDVTPPGAPGVSRPAVLTDLTAWLESSTLLQTSDAGRTWRSLGPLPMFRARGNGALFPVRGALDFIDERNGWRMMSAGTAGSEEVDIHRTADGGATWVQVARATPADESSGLPFGGNKSGITFLSATAGWVTGYQPGCGHTYLFATRDGGHTWRRQRLPLPARVKRWNGSTTSPMFFTARDGVLPVSLSYSVGNEYCEDGKTVVVIYVTRDGGATWTATTPVDGHGAPVWSFVDLAHGWIAGAGVLYRTADGGRRWTALPLPADFADIHQLDFVSPQVGWAVRGSVWTLKRTPGSLLKTVDGGHTWAPVAYTVSHR